MDTPMPKPILVPLTGSDRIELFLPDLETMAGPGTKVVFFVHYGLAGFREVMEQLLAVQLGARPEVMAVTSDENPLLDNGIAPDKRTILPALDALKKKGVQIEVNLYGLTIDQDAAGLPNAETRYTDRAT
jgi:hypothetical protein